MFKHKGTCTKQGSGYILKKQDPQLSICTSQGVLYVLPLQRCYPTRPGMINSLGSAMAAGLVKFARQVAIPKSSMEYLTATALSPNVHVAIFSPNVGKKSSHPMRTAFDSIFIPVATLSKGGDFYHGHLKMAVKNSWQVNHFRLMKVEGFPKKYRDFFYRKHRRSGE